MHILPLVLGAVERIRPGRAEIRSPMKLQNIATPRIYFLSAFLAVSVFADSDFGLSSFFAPESPFAEEPAEAPAGFLA